ncbi:MAG: M67 family metallopeptidase [Chitinophagales bacterium]
MKVILSGEAKATMVEDALSTYPHECCGFFYGNEKDNRVITKSIPVNNSKEENRERRFEISAKDYIKAEEYADENNLLLLGVYHSHPDHPAIPSEHDLRQAVPYFSYIIISVKKGKLANILSWRLNDEARFEEENLEIKKEEINLDQFLN